MRSKGKQLFAVGTVYRNANSCIVKPPPMEKEGVRKHFAAGFILIDRSA